MATKEELELEMLKIFDDFSHIFDLLKLPRVKYLVWLEGFDTYTELKAAHWHVIHKMLPLLNNTINIWNKHPKVTWISMRLTLPTHDDVVKLRNAEFLIKEQWQNRPKCRRKY